jgi:hypothetical protein
LFLVVFFAAGFVFGFVFGALLVLGGALGVGFAAAGFAAAGFAFARACLRVSVLENMMSMFCWVRSLNVAEGPEGLATSGNSGPALASAAWALAVSGNGGL